MKVVVDMKNNASGLVDEAGNLVQRFEGFIDQVLRLPGYFDAPVEPTVVDGSMGVVDTSGPDAPLVVEVPPVPEPEPEAEPPVVEPPVVEVPPVPDATQTVITA